MKNFTQKFIGLLALVFTMSLTINAQDIDVSDICNDPAACNYGALNNDVPCIYIVTSDMAAAAQSTFDAAQTALQAAQSAFDAAVSARVLMDEAYSSSSQDFDASEMAQLANISAISISQSDLLVFASDLEGVLSQLAIETLNLTDLEIDINLEEVAMAAANIALQGAQEYLTQAQALSDAALVDFEAAEFESFDAGQAVDDAWEAYNFSGNLQDNALEALGVAQLEEEATQYALDLGVSALNAASEELINALGAIGLAEEAATAKAVIVEGANLAMEGAQAALALAQAVSDVALTDFNAAEVESFDLATSLTDALELQTFYEDAMANAMEELGIAQLQQETTQYGADLAATALNQASEELIGALGAIGLAEEATAAKAAILEGANATMDLAQAGLDQAQSAVDLANSSLAVAYDAVASAQSLLSSATSTLQPLLSTYQSASSYLGSLDSELCTYTPEISAVWTPAVESYLITSAVNVVCTGGYYQTITPATSAVWGYCPTSGYTTECTTIWPFGETCVDVPWIGSESCIIIPAIPASTVWVPEVCTPYIPAVYSPYVAAVQVSPYIPSTNICIPNPEVAIAATAEAASWSAYNVALAPFSAAELALDGVLLTQSVAQVAVDQATSVVNSALSAVSDQIAIVQNAQGDLNLAEEAENNANAAYAAAQDPEAVAQDAVALANQAADLALETAGDWQALVEQNTGNALAALNTYEITAPLAEAAEIALEGFAAAAEIANAELNSAIQDEADKIAMLQNAQSDLDLAEEAENNANAVYSAAQDPEAAAQAAADLAQTAADHAVSVVADAQALAESGAGNLLALLNDYEALAPLAEAAELGLELATTVMAEVNAAYTGALEDLSSELETVQTYEYSIEELTALLLTATQSISDLSGMSTASEAMISTTEASLLLLTGESLDLEALVLQASNLMLSTLADLDVAINEESLMLMERVYSEGILAEATLNVLNNTTSGLCAICEVDEAGNAYINSNDADNDGVCDVVALITGCTDSAASNYDSNAVSDDNSCESWEQLANQLQNNLEIAIANQGHNVVYVNAYLDLPEGWSMIGYTCMNSQDVVHALISIENSIEIIKDDWGLSYLPEWGFNAIGDFNYGEGYQIKLNETVEQFQFCTVPVID